MQRRSFLINAACVGACASMLAPLSEVVAAASGEAATRLRLQRLPDAALPALGAGGLLQVRATPIALGALDDTLRVRLWVASDAGPRAFDFATFARSGSSQPLRFVVSPSDLIGFDVASGRHFDDCNAEAACDAGPVGLAPGRYRLWLSSADADIAAVDLQVDAQTR